MRIGGVVLVALVEWAGSAWAGVNGSGYDWWTWVLRALAVLTLVLAFAPFPRLPLWTAFAAAPVAIAAVVVTTQHFNDSYRGTRAWPDALAVTFGAAVAVAELAALARSAGTRRMPSPGRPRDGTT